MHSYMDLPEKYHEILHIDLQKDKKLAFLVNGIAVVILIIMAIIGQCIVPIRSLFDMSDGLLAYVWRYVVILAGTVLYMVLHELVHGIVMWHYSRQKPFYGFTGLYAYAGSNCYFDKKSYIVIALAPIVVWGAVLGIVNAFCSAEWFWVFYFIQIINISGAAGDMYVSWRFSKLPEDILIKDVGVSMTIFSEEEIG